MHLGDALVEVGASLGRGKLRALDELSQVAPRNMGGPGFKFADGAVEGGVKASVKLRRGFVGEAFDKLLSFSKGLLGIAGEGLEAAGNFFGAAAINNQLFFPEVLGLGQAGG